MGGLEHHDNILGRLIDGWRKHRRVQQDRAFLSNSDAVDIERMAADVGMGVDELADVIARGEDPSDLPARMMTAHGFDHDDLAAGSPLSLREINVTCSRCAQKHRCEVELDAGTAALHAEGFCPNAQLMQVLGREMNSSSAGAA